MKITIEHSHNLDEAAALAVATGLATNPYPGELNDISVENDHEISSDPEVIQAAEQHLLDGLGGTELEYRRNTTLDAGAFLMVDGTPLNGPLGFDPYYDLLEPPAQ